MHLPKLVTEKCHCMEQCNHCMRRTKCLYCSILLPRTDGLKVSYRSAVDQTQHSNLALKRKAQKETSKDIECSFGPPDKKQHFGSVQGKKSKKGKGKCRADDTKEKTVTSEGAKEVEVLYADGK